MAEDAMLTAYAQHVKTVKDVSKRTGTSYGCFVAGFKYAESVLKPTCDWHGPCVHGYYGKLPQGDCDYRECGCVQIPTEEPQK